MKSIFCNLQFHIDEVIFNGEDITEFVNQHSAEWMNSHLELIGGILANISMFLANGIISGVINPFPELVEELMTCF